MRKWIERSVSVVISGVVVAIVLTNIPAMSGPSSMQNVITAVTSDTTASDTSNCINLYKPYRIVLPIGGRDTLMTREVMQTFANHLDLQFDEVYARVRDAVCEKITQDMSIPCAISIDTIQDCNWDSLLVNKRMVVMLDLDSAIAPKLRFHEKASSGRNFVEIQARDMDTSYSLRWPKSKYDSIDGRTRSDMYFDEIGVDSGGNLIFHQRNVAETYYVDTIIARYNTGSGIGSNADLVLKTRTDLTGVQQVHVYADDMALRAGCDLHLYANGDADYVKIANINEDETYWIVLPDDTLFFVNPGWGGPNSAGPRYTFLQCEDSNGDNVWRTRFYPMTGLTQSGIISEVNTSMDRDTVVFARRDVALGTECHSCGHRYFDKDYYSVTVNWGEGSGGYVGDSLWIESKNDTMFVVGIKYSATARKIQWVAHGYYNYMLP